MKKLTLILCALLFLVGCSGGTAQNTELSTANEISIEDWREFDKRSSGDFEEIYKAHNHLMKVLESDDIVAQYQAFSEFEKWFRQWSLAFNYHENDEQKQYLSVLEDICLSDQMASSSLKKYLDTSQIKYLNDAQQNIARATEGISTFASNRGKLLADKAGYTDEEIQEISSNFLVETFEVGTTATIKTESANVRTGPGKTNDIVRTIPKNTTVEIFDKTLVGDTEWLKIGENEWISINVVNGNL